MNRIKRFITPPVFEGDEEKSQTANVLNAVLLAYLAAMVIYASVSVFFPNPVVLLAFLGVAVLLGAGPLALMRRGHVRAASLIFLSAMWVLITIAAAFSDGLYGSSIFATVPLTVIAGLLLGWRGGFAFAGASALIGLAMLGAASAGVLPASTLSNSPVSMWAALAIYLVVAAAVLHIATSNLQRALERTRQNNREMELIRASLEDRVAARTRELQEFASELTLHSRQLETTNLELEQARRRQETINLELREASERTRRRAAQLQAITEVGRAIAQMRDPERLLSHVTALISQHFGFYHAGIFLLDEAQRYAVLRAANSEGGQRMLARNHKLQVGAQGIVGFVTATGQARIALDVGADAVHFTNPDLPETRSEMALPLQMGEQIIGALDVQSRQPGAFDDQDVAVLSALADQVAIAIENARLFQQTQAIVADAQELQRRYLEQSWQTYLAQQDAPRVEYAMPGVPSALDLELSISRQAMAQGELVAVSEPVIQDDGVAVARAALSVPIKLRGQVIGVLDLHEVEEARRWTPQEMALVQSVVDQMAQALEAARLFEQAQVRAQREALTRRITDHIRNALDVDTMLKTTVQELGRALGASRVYVRLGEESAPEDASILAVATPSPAAKTGL